MALLFTTGLYAQSGTNSPYSQYGLGVLTDHSQGFNRGMNGVGLGIRRGNIVNTLNPASYSAVDSLTMIFDVGLSGQITNFKEGGTRVNANNADFEYAAGIFRMLPNLGVSFGILPYSNIGYSYSTSRYLDASQVTLVDTYSGSGGLHQAFIGAGWRVLKPLSVGFNLSYLWGSISRSVTTTGSDYYIRTLSKTYGASVRSYNLDFGMQWQQKISKTDELTVGLTLGIGHKLGADPTCDITIVDSQTSVSDTTHLSVENGLSIPMTYGAGVAYNHAGKLLVGADFTMQKWGSLDYPAEVGNSYVSQQGLLKDRYKLNVGLDYVPSVNDRKSFIKQVHYRAGIGYATPYYTINGKDGPKELSISAGFGIPLMKNQNGLNRSMLNVSAQWAHTSAKDLITENTFRINVGLTFNERWFAKWKID